MDHRESKPGAGEARRLVACCLGDPLKAGTDICFGRHVKSWYLVPRDLTTGEQKCPCPLQCMGTEGQLSHTFNPSSIPLHPDSPLPGLRLLSRAAPDCIHKPVIKTTRRTTSPTKNVLFFVGVCFAGVFPRQRSYQSLGIQSLLSL